MKRRRAYVMTFAALGGLVAAVGLLAAGCEMCCNSSKGSGSILITDVATHGTHKATFTYEVQCIGSNDPSQQRTVSGRLEYQDHRPWTRSEGAEPKIVRIHGSVGDVVYTEDLAENPLFLAQLSTYAGNLETVCTQTEKVAAFKGTYKPQPASLGEGGTFTIMVWDKGKPGASPEDTFTMELTDGVFDTYKVSGVLAGGNIKAL